MGKFEELAEKRMNEVIKKIRLIGNLSNKGNYNYTDAHIKQIMNTLKTEISLLEDKFNASNKDKEETFKFKK